VTLHQPHRKVTGVFADNHQFRRLVISSSSSLSSSLTNMDEGIASKSTSLTTLIRGHYAVIGVRRPSVCPSDVAYIGSNSKKGLGRRNFAQGYPRSHATHTPTSRSKCQKSRSRGVAYCGGHLAAQLVNFTEVQQLMSEYLHELS